MKLNQKKLVVLLSSLLITINLSSCNNGHSASNNNSVFDMFSNSEQQVNATSQTWSYSYNSKHLLETAKDPNGNVYRYDYDNAGRLTKITNPLKQTISFSDFEKHGKPQTIIDQNGIVTKLTYTSEGWLLNSTTDGATTRIDHDQVGNIDRITFPDNNSLLFVYDGANYLMEIQGMDGLIKYTRDEAGNVTSTVIGGNSGITYSQKDTYDEINRLTMSSGADGKLTMYKYDNDDNIIDYWTENIKSTLYSYDDLQRIKSAVDIQGGETKFTYNNNENLNSPNSIIDARGNKTIYSYNGIANLLKLISPDSGTHNYSAYDSNSNLLEQVDANGKLITYTYDELNRPKEIKYASDQNLNTVFTYDQGTNAIGRLSKVQNTFSSNSYSYDARGNVLNEIQKINNNDYSLRYAYNKADKLTNIIYPSNLQVVYSYTNGQISKVTASGKLVADIRHLPFGPINEIKYGNNVSEHITYNTNYQLNGIYLNNGLLTRTYGIYGRAKISEISGIGSYYYNMNGPLNLFMNEDYSYMEFYYSDILGNIFEQRYNNYADLNDGSIKIEYNVDPKSNRISNKTVIDGEYGPMGVINYSYDNAGNMTKSGTTNYIYNSINQLQAVTMDDKQNSKEIANYQYNAFSQRIMKNVNGRKIIFIYNSAGQLLEERDLQTNVVRDYIYADGKLIGAFESSKDIKDGVLVYIVTDHLNAPQLVMDDSGKQIWKADYQPFGQAKITGYLKFNLRADGQYQDDETGLYYNWYRYYNPDLGRYITSDPLGLQAGMNTYIYVNGNPINYTDPMGLWINVAAGILWGAGSEALNQALIHGSDWRSYNYRDIAIAGAFGVIPGGAARYLSKAPNINGFKKLAIEYGSIGISNVLQSATINYCNNEENKASPLTVSGIQAMEFALLGNTTNTLFRSIFKFSGLPRSGAIVGEASANIIPTLVDYKSKYSEQNNK